jgi:hypothetical protein
MPTCDYCDESFDGEGPYLEHLGAAHEGELGSIDQRRVAAHDGESGRDLSLGPIILVGVIGIAVAIVAYVILFVGPGGNPATADVAQEPGPVGSAHDHGTINMTVAGDRVDFSAQRFQTQDEAFHFEGGQGRIWHAHATGVTLEYAMATLGIELAADEVGFEGETYRDSDPETTVTVTVNGEAVTPATYVLEGESEANADAGDHVRIVVQTNESA